MSHITCDNCGSTEHCLGYGLAAGGIGTYTSCLNCGKILESQPDPEYNLPQEALCFHSEKE